MPIYTYQCPDGHIIDELRNMDHRDTPSPCQVCRATLKRLLSPPNIVLKGPDWARNG